MKLSSLLSSHKVTALAVALALSTAACTQKPAETTEPVTPAAEPAAAPTETAPASTAPEALAAFAPFTGSLPADITNKECALDTVNGQAPAATTSFDAGASAALGGWAGNGAGQVASNFHLVLKGATQSFSTAIQPSVARPDVATSLNAPGLENSGYTLNMSLAGVPAGDYAMYLADPSNTQATCDLRYAFNLK